ncbi:MAG: hypothetical protein ACW987_18700, partial [Candidatus Thorarchaeota archaeon]
RAYNSEGIKMMFGGAGSWNEPALPPRGSCALCQEELQVIELTALCKSCGAFYIRSSTKLWDYLGKVGRYVKT